MIAPLAYDPSHLAEFARLETPAVRRACTRTMSAINISRPQNSVIQIAYAGMTLTHTVFRKWSSQHESGIAASMWTAEWQVVWETQGVYVGGDQTAFNRDVLYLMMDDSLDFNFTDLLVVGVSQETADRLLPVG